MCKLKNGHLVKVCIDTYQELRSCITADLCMPKTEEMGYTESEYGRGIVLVNPSVETTSNRLKHTLKQMWEMKNLEIVKKSVTFVKTI